MTDGTRRMISARTTLIIEQPFFGSLALSLQIQEDPTCETAWVDGRTLGFNPAFIASLSHEKVTALVAHEVMHCALGHPWRRDARAMGNWNIACDKTINTELREAGFTLPDDAYYANGDEVGKSSEWIFSRMSDQPKDDPNGKGKGSDSLGELRDAPNDEDGKGNSAPTEQEWKERVIGAMQQAKLAGKLPASMQRAIQEALKPRLDVRSLLLRFFSERCAADYTWTKPNTRYIAQGLYLPSLESRSLGNVAIMVDTSGSIDAKSLEYARGIVESVIDECNPASVTVYYSDAQVCSVERFEQGESLTWKPQGGGGTDFRPVLQAIQEADESVCALCITDLEGSFPDTAPDLPVLWLATPNYAGNYHTAPFGETIPIDR